MLNRFPKVSRPRQTESGHTIIEVLVIALAGGTFLCLFLGYFAPVFLRTEAIRDSVNASKGHFLKAHKDATAVKSSCTRQDTETIECLVSGQVGDKKLSESLVCRGGSSPTTCVEKPATKL